MTIAMIASTTSISTRVKPAERRGCVVIGVGPQVGSIAEGPISNVVLIRFGAALETVGPERIKIELGASRARLTIPVFVSPRIGRDARHVSPASPVTNGGILGFLNECAQSLRGRRQTGGIEPIHRERGFDGLEIGSNLGDSRLVHTIHDTRDDEGRQQPDDHDHDHDFDEGEASCLAAAQI